MTLPDKLDERGPMRKLARHYNQLRDYVNSLKISKGVGYEVDHKAAGQQLRVKRARAESVPSGIEIRRVQVTNCFEKYLTCQQLSGLNLIGPQISVQRPYATFLNDELSLPKDLPANRTIALSLNNLDYTQRTITWQAVISTVLYEFSIDQYIFPYYNPSIFATQGARIFAVRGTTGGTEPGPDGQELNWVDLNTDGRHWAFAKLEAVEVCVNNVTRFTYIIKSQNGVAV